MNPKVLRLFALFTGFLAMCSVVGAVVLGLRLKADRMTLHRLDQAPSCAPVKKHR